MDSKPRFLFSSLLFLTFFVTFAAAHIGQFDEYWKKKAELAEVKNRASYNPDPDSVTSHFNAEVHTESIDMEDDTANNTRRGLRGKRMNSKNEPCVATNPIDRCWRCRSDWSKNRKLMAKCAKGFGRHTTGGLDGRFYIVTNPADDDMVNPKKGTLRWGVIQDRPLWIVFASDMIIRLNEELIVNSNKTIDGRGYNVRIVGGASMMLQFIHNVIITNLHIHDIVPGDGGMIRDSETHYGFRTRSDGDGISIFGSSNIWIDHVSMANCGDGLIDAIMGSTAITISNSHFTQHNDRIILNVTLLQVTKREYSPENIWKDWNWRSEGDLLMNGAVFVPSGVDPNTNSIDERDLIKAKPGTFVTRLTRYSGALDCVRGRPC
ncbi:hypothetical protein ZIOFF_047394 [Zingiber officinale]|uniref:Pectate lyase n=1 Tax=Zingiber officinale TaxID=94328 RepID=A0A8J5FP32_ZINOF|nr:hypothetical protein ZIOFF_047394 [Zingiber officinale]